MNNLLDFKKVVHSQWGEDGIIEEIFKRLGTSNKLCVEFGAGAGYLYSNVWNLLDQENWSGLLIECDEEHLANWREILQDGRYGERVKLIDKKIEIKGENSIASVLKDNNYPFDLDLLSIDIDSDDYHIWAHLEDYRPRLVMIEHNPTMPPGFRAVQEPGANPAYGASASSLLDLAHGKGYLLATATHTNSFFVRQEDFVKLGVDEAELKDVFDNSALTYIIQAYNGSCYFKNRAGAPSWRGFKEVEELRLSQQKSLAVPLGLSDVFTYSASLSQLCQPIKVFWAEVSPGSLGKIIARVSKKIFKKFS